jgi:hypothetical protein
MLFGNSFALAGFSALSLFAHLSTAHNIQMRPHQKDCFFETLHKGDRMSVTYQVGDREFGNSGSMDVDFWVSDRWMICGIENNI